MEMLSICISCKNFGYDGDLNTYFCKDKHDDNFGTLDGCRFLVNLLMMIGRSY